MRDKRGREEIPRGIMRAFAESDVRSESDAFTRRSKISRASPDNRSQFLSRNARTLSTPAGFISPEFLFGDGCYLLLPLPPSPLISVTFHGLTERGRGSFRFNDRPWSFGPATRISGLAANTSSSSRQSGRYRDVLLILPRPSRALLSLYLPWIFDFSVTTQKSGIYKMLR